MTGSRQNCLSQNLPRKGHSGGVGLCLLGSTLPATSQHGASVTARCSANWKTCPPPLTKGTFAINFTETFPVAKEAQDRIINCSFQWAFVNISSKYFLPSLLWPRSDRRALSLWETLALHSFTWRFTGDVRERWMSSEQFRHAESNSKLFPGKSKHDSKELTVCYEGWVCPHSQPCQGLCYRLRYGPMTSQPF